jgi:hypothetical protein
VKESESSTQKKKKRKKKKKEKFAAANKALFTAITQPLLKNPRKRLLEQSILACQFISWISDRTEQQQNTAAKHKSGLQQKWHFLLLFAKQTSCCDHYLHLFLNTIQFCFCSALLILFQFFVLLSFLLYMCHYHLVKVKNDSTQKNCISGLQF